MSPEQAEVLASRRFSGEENRDVFRVPPPIADGLSRGTFTNSETAGPWGGRGESWQRLSATSSPIHPA
jgi:hypothetical protein